MQHALLFLITILSAPATSPSSLGLRHLDETGGHTDHLCDLDVADDGTCRLACYNETGDDFLCACRDDGCACEDSVTGASFTLEPERPGDLCGELRRGGGHTYGPCCIDTQQKGCSGICPIKAPPADNSDCSPCLHGCTDGVCN